MREIGSYILAFFVTLVLLVVGGLVIQGSEFFMYRWFAPRQEQARREVFEESKAYNDGMVQDLQAMMFAYVQAKPEHQAALAATILHRAANYDTSKLPPDLRQFVDQLRRARLEGSR